MYCLCSILELELGIGIIQLHVITRSAQTCGIRDKDNITMSTAPDLTLLWACHYI